MSILKSIKKNSLTPLALVMFGMATFTSCQNKPATPVTAPSPGTTTADTAAAVKTKDIVMMVNLVDDSAAIAAYDQYHAKAWPEVIAANEPANIKGVKIYRLANKLVMILTVPENWDGDKDNNYVKSSPRVKEWLDIMEKFQRPSPEAPAGTKGWATMKLVFGYKGGKQVYE